MLNNCTVQKDSKQILILMNQSESSLYNSFSGKAQLKITGMASPTLDRRNKYRQAQL